MATRAKCFLGYLFNNVNANSQKNRTVETILKNPKKEKKGYTKRIMHVEHATFTPLVFSLTRGEGLEASMFHKNIAQKVSAKIEKNYDRVLSPV